jgi:FAD/FMN-containing dehydrogenase
MTETTITAEGFADTMRQILGHDGFTDALPDRVLVSQDVWARGELADFVLRPTTVQQLCDAVAACHERGIALNPRGGGMSYTNGYAPDRQSIGLLDLAALDEIVEINAQDMYVTVQAGTTWKALHDALKPLGLRTPFWGPLSGISSTVGGGVSQNNAFFGAGTCGPTSDSVVSVAVVLADGTLVRTGTGGTANGTPFWRHYGPDLTGLFMGDCGALGYKAEITLRLIPAPEFEDWASYEFNNRDGCARAMGELARQNLACEVFGFDPNLTRVRLKRASLMADMGTLTKVMGKQGSVFKGLKEGAKIAMAGRNFMAEESWSLHFVVEGRSKAGVADDMARLRKICVELGGRETENSIPKIIRANPFTPLNNMLGPEGERWVPVHGIVPISKGPQVWEEIETLFEEMADEFEAHKVQTGYLITSMSTNGYLIEPVFLWPEEIFDIHEVSVESSILKKLPRHEPNPGATEVVARARQAVVDIFSRHGGAHFQIGRAYPYREGRQPEALALLEQIKHAIDPQNRINPGALGLGR